MSIGDTVSKWDNNERAAAIRQLLQFPLGLEPFFAWCETTITCPNEYCILRPYTTWFRPRMEILLFKRPSSDPVFGGQWHVSGGLMLPGDKADDVWKRLSQGTKYGLAKSSLSAPTFIGAIDTPKGPQEEGSCPRSQERNFIHVVYHAEGDTPDGAKWFRLSELPLTGPDRLIGHHQRYIREILIPWLDRK